MKRTLALLLALLLIALPACAQEYMRQLPQYAYYSDTLINWEAYPEVRIAPYSAYNFFKSNDPVEPKFLCFPCPNGGEVSSFDIDFVSFLDVNESIQYSYQVRTSDSYEEFINKATDDAYILLDGSDGTAAYIVPDELRAYGMIGTKEFGKSSKLLISIKLDALTTRMPLEDRVQALSDAILPEVTRVAGQMRYETFDPWWNDGTFAGVKFLETRKFEQQLRVDFPIQTLTIENGPVSASLMITAMRYNTLYGVYNFGHGAYVQVEIEGFETNPFPLYEQEQGEKDVAEVTLSSGRTWTLYMSGLTDYGKSTLCYACTPLGIQSDYGDDYYLNIELNGNNIAWSSPDDLAGDLEPFDAAFELMDASADPYQPTERPAVEDVAPAADDGHWVCPECGSENSGNFCTSCGTAKPAAEWTCPTCGSVNEGNFCPNDGTARP